jgi:hypothetical protein
LSRREALLSAGFALWGVAIAIALIPILSGPPYEGQTPSYATKIGLDARAPMRFIVSLIVLPVLMSLFLRPVARRLANGTTAMGIVAGLACVIGLWTALIAPSLPWTVIPTLIGIAVATLLRHRDMQFTRHDMILLPTCMVIFLGLVDATGLPVDRALIVTGAIALAVRLAVTLIPSSLPPAFALALAPLGVVLQMRWVPAEVRYAGWYAVAFAVVTPLILRLVMRSRRYAALLVAWVVYPIFCYAYANAISIPTTEGKPRVDFFEDATHLVTASELIRGEQLYRDVIPIHGLIDDGLLSYVALRGDVTIGRALERRIAVATLNGVMVYALAAAATGSPQAGVAAFVFSTLLGTTPLSPRSVPALAGLAFLAAAVRRRHVWLFAAAAVCAVVAFFTSLDYGVYTAIAVVIGAARSRPVKPAIFAVIISAVVTTALFMIALAASGIADDFLRVSGQLLSTAHAMTLDVFTPSASLRARGTIPEVLTGVFDRSAYLVILWVAVLVLTAVAVSRRSMRRLEPLVLIGVWTVLSAISYGGRHHFYFQFAIAVLLVTATWILSRRRSSYVPVLVVVLVAMAYPTAHIAIAGWLRRTHAPLEDRWVEISDLPRARGALFTRTDATMIATVRKYVDTRLAPHETFFDFSDRGLLYFLLRRDDPIRHPVVTFYQADKRQREVIRLIERNPDVKAALIGYGGMDGVPNQQRAPLVWEYLQQNFEPEFHEGDVTIWRRKL